MEKSQINELEKKLLIINQNQQVIENHESQKGVEQAQKGLSWQEKIQELQFLTDRIRNICILAHVDHGKTTLADSLISSNHIINQKLAGQLRYLDSREDEQQRMITMKASSISLLYSYKTKIKKGKDESGKPIFDVDEKQHLINLIDSPGHVDFSNEVSSALRMSDGALVLVDVVEGISSQTHTVIKQAWAEKVKMCLVLNKIDRLIIEREMNGQQIYMMMVNIIEQVNGIISELIKQDIIESGEQNSEQYDQMIELQEKQFQFFPENGNVAFSSAYDCWSFTIPGFLPTVAQKLGMNAKALQKFMWGSYFYNPSKKEVTKIAPSNQSKEMFVQFIMNPLVELYSNMFNKENNQTTAQLRDSHSKIKEKLQKQMPMENGVLRMVVEHVPSPLKAQQIRYKKFCPLLDSPNPSKELQEIKNSILNCEINKQISDDNAPTTVYVTKMQPFSSRMYDIVTKSHQKSENKQRLIAISRVFSGTLQVGQKVYVMGARHQYNNEEDVQEFEIIHLFLLMGSSLKLIERAPAGCIVGIGGLDDILIKTGTISSSPHCPNFIKQQTISMGLVKVAIQTKEFQHMGELKEGLMKLNKADPSVQFFTNDKGEMVLSTCGEIHLQRCIKDLNDDFCPGIELEISDPIIPFRETILNKRLTNKIKKNKQENYEEGQTSSESEDEKTILQKADKSQMTAGELFEYEERLEKYNEQLAIEKELLKKEQSLDPYLEKLLEIKLQQGDEKLMRRQQEQKGWAKDFTSNKMCQVKVRAVGLDFEITKWLEKNQKDLQDFQDIVQIQNIQNISEQKIQKSTFFVRDFFKLLVEKKTSKKLIQYIRDFTSGFGPKRSGSNILINKFNDKNYSLFQKFANIANQQQILPKFNNDDSQKYLKDYDECIQKLLLIEKQNQITSRELNSSMIAGFDMAALKGPLMDEQMQGAVFIIEDLQLNQDNLLQQIDNSNFGSFGGQIMSTVKNLCKKSFLNSDPRIVEGMYLCSLQASPETYGIVYNVINKCRGTVIKEDMQDGTNFFLLDAVIPLVEGFLFTEKIRKSTSGIAYPQLIFYGFEVNAKNDPLYLPLTEEELEDHGSGEILQENFAKLLIEKVRKQKGMIVSKKLAVDAEKQRTLKKNK